MSRTSAPLFRSYPRVAWPVIARVGRQRRRRHLRWCVSAVLGAIAVLGSGAPVSTVPSPTMPGVTGSVDRIVVAIPPVHTGSPPGFPRLPETQSAPVGTAVAPGFAGPGPVVPGVPGDRRFPGPGPATPGMGDGRPVWSAARLEPVVGVDARGHVTSIREYTPGRFER